MKRMNKRANESRHLATVVSSSALHERPAVDLAVSVDGVDVMLLSMKAVRICCPQLKGHPNPEQADPDQNKPGTLVANPRA